ncbi:MAG: membrane protein insertase YidC [Candidatus Yanofskybacteria bacterium]|nr:membrane protein insertase YidC [Candidatus Yanofskybacteria bacterium]
MTYIFNEILYRPIFNFLVFIYNLIPGADFGLAIIVLTLIVRLVFMPLSIKALRSQKLMTKLQPKIKELQARHRDDKAAQAQAVMALYKENKVNPASGCLPLIIQLPVLFALYKAFANGFNPESLKLLYGFIKNPDTINSISFGFFDLSKNSPALAVLSGVFQFLHSKLSFAKQESGKNPDAGSSLKGSFDMGAMNKQMLYFFPIMIIIIGWKLPAGLVLYWAVTTLFSMFEQLYINKKFA